MQLTAVGSGYYRVEANGVEISKHVTEREAIESAVTQKRADPTAAVRYAHEYLVNVTAPPVAVEEPGVPPEDEDPPVVTTPEPPPQVEPPLETPDLPAPPGEGVQYASEEQRAIMGDQLPLGSARQPHPWYDKTQLERGASLISEALAPDVGWDHFSGYVMYYDLPLCEYILAHKAGSAALMDSARQVTDAWAARLDSLGQWGKVVAPRSANLLGLMLRALDGRPELWAKITDCARFHLPMWLLQRLDYAHLHYGVRDGGLTLLGSARLAQTHPDAAVRDEMRQAALDAATLYYARLQREDGGWYYKVAGKDVPQSQPFQVGLLLEGMIATHQLTGEQAVADSIVRAVDWLWTWGFDNREPWKAMYYFVSEAHEQTPNHAANAVGPTWEARQLNATCIHAFGYAHRLTGDPKYIDQGDTVLEATFGFDPKAPKQSTGLAFYRGKEWCQSYRSSGRYLVDRLD